LTVIIEPSAAVSAGAKWRVNGGSWQTSGNTVTGLEDGNPYTLDFTAVEGWTTPENYSTTITGSEDAVLRVSYTETEKGSGDDGFCFLGVIIGHNI
jgi:hypothetical protein